MEGYEVGQESDGSDVWRFRSQGEYCLFLRGTSLSHIPGSQAHSPAKQLIGAKLDRVTWDHPYAPSPRPTQTPPPLAQQHFVDETPEDPDADPELVRDWKPKPSAGEGDHAHFAHVCHVEEWGLLLVQQFQYG